MPIFVWFVLMRICDPMSWSFHRVYGPFLAFTRRWYHVFNRRRCDEYGCVNRRIVKNLLYQQKWHWLYTLRPRQNGRHFADDTFKRIFLNGNVRISIKISLKFVPKGPTNNNPAWRRSGDKPLSEPMMVSLLTHICVTRPQWVNNSQMEKFPDMEHITRRNEDA